MPMTEQEIRDIEILKDKIVKLKAKTLEIMLWLDSLTEQQLINSGYRKGIGDALLVNIRALKSDINRATQEHIKKYPD